MFWYTGVVLITKLDNKFAVSVVQKLFWTFEIIPNPRDTAPLDLHGNRVLCYLKVRVKFQNMFILSVHQRS